MSKNRPTYRIEVWNNPEADDIGPNRKPENVRLYRFYVCQMIEDFNEEEELGEAEKPAFGGVFTRVAADNGVGHADGLG